MPTVPKLNPSAPDWNEFPSFIVMETGPVVCRYCCMPFWHETRSSAPGISMKKCISILVTSHGFRLGIGLGIELGFVLVIELG